MKWINTILKSLFFNIFLLSSLLSNGQTVVKGFVKDAGTMRPIQFVSIYFDGGKGVTSGSDGSYSIVLKNSKLTNLNFSFAGYKKISKKLIVGKEQIINIELELYDVLQNVVVKTRKRAKYRNKDNPAVELINLVIYNKKKNRIKAYDFVQYQQYEKLSLSLTNKPEKLLKNRLFKNYKFILENIDSTSIEGKSLLPIYIEEKLSDRFLRKNPEADKTIIRGEKYVTYGDFLDANGISQYLKMMYGDIDIYDNNVNILRTQFLSPIADMGPSFYRYYITDTVEQEGLKLIKLYFTPRNPNDLIFRGYMLITLDGNYGVQKINMTISKNANLNWARELRITQDYEKATDGRFHLIKSNMLAEFALTQNASGGVMGERSVSFKKFKTDIPAHDSIYLDKDLVNKSNTSSTVDSFWVDKRHNPLTQVEAKAYYNIDSLKNMRSFKNFGEIVSLLFSGYYSFGKWELGNTNTFYNFNPIEGLKLKVGGRTTPKFSNFLYFDNAISFGFKDEKFKFLSAVTYSFNHKSIYAFPLNYLKISYQYDTNIPGQELQFVQEDNVFLSFKRGNNKKWLYNNYLKGEYIYEFGKSLSYTLGFKNWIQTPAGDIFFQKTSDLSKIKNITTTEFSGEFRWAPNYQFYQGKNFRIPIINKYPIFNLRFIAGVKGLMKGEYNYQNLSLHIEKRFFLSQLGYIDATLEGGHTFGQLPFPLLSIHRANQTYSFQLESYNLMNFMEFISDQYVAGTANVHFNGFFLNKIPLIKKLKLREVVSAKILYGSVRDENNPAKTNNLLKFPTDILYDQPTTFALSKEPYIELSVGVGNIFKFARIDLVKRLSYLDHPGISTLGLRIRIAFDF